MMWRICGSDKLKRSACFSEKMNLEAVPSLSASRAQQSNEVSAEPKPVVRVLLPIEPSCLPSPSKAEVHQPSFPIEPSCSRAAVHCPFSQASFRCPLSWANIHRPSEVSWRSLPVELRYIIFYRPLRWAVFHPFSIKALNYDIYLL